MLKQVCAILVILFVHSSIHSQYYYKPDNTSTLLMLSQKGDAKLSATLPIDGQVNFQLGYSPLKNFALSLSTFRHDNTRDTIFEGTKGRQFSGAIGFYAFYNQTGYSSSNTISNNEFGFLMDLYLGIAKGNIQNNYQSITSSKLKYQKLFVQLGLHLKAKYLSVNFATKISFLDYQKGVITGDSNIYEIAVIEEKISLDEPYLLLETDLRLNIGPESFSGFAGISMIHPNILEKDIVQDQRLLFSVGLTMDINRIFRAKKTSKR